MSRRSGSASRTRGVAASSRDTGPTLFDMTMCSASERATLLPSTSSAAASPAKTCRAQGRRLVSMVSEAVFGGSSHESFASFDPDSWSWRTSQRSLISGWTTFSEAFPIAGTMRSGRAFALPTLVLHTAASDCSSSPGAWPTATASDANGSGSRNTATSKAHPGTSLTDAVRGDGGTGRWPTPCASDHHGSYRPGQRRGQLGDAVQCHGRLNPDWVEALMGFPPGWTRIDGPSGAESSSPTESRRESPTSAESERSG